jgi:hypothetical protein
VRQQRASGRRTGFAASPNLLLNALQDCEQF